MLMTVSGQGADVDVPGDVQSCPGMSWGCPVLCTGAGAGHWLWLSQSRPEHWQVSAP